MARSPQTQHPQKAPRRVPRQRRSREIVEAILEAARQLLESQGPEALTTNRVAERAGISIGSLYRYFPDKAAVVAALCAVDARRDAEAIAEGEWPIDHLPLAEGLVQLVDFQLERHRRLVSRFGAFYREGHRAHSLARSLGTQQVEAHLRDLLSRRRGEARVSDVDQAAYLLARGISSILRGALEERPEKLEQPGFRSELIDMVTRYVLADSTQAGGEDRR